jgi:ketosteroid isomerase-like protein
MEESATMTVTNEVLDRHMKTFGSQDMAGVLADYAADAVMFTPNGPVRGTEELRKGFEQLFAEWAKPGVKFTLKQRIVDGKNAYIFWDAETADNLYEGAMDAFVVENGKIVAHFFSGKITPKAAASTK